MPNCYGGGRSSDEMSYTSTAATAQVIHFIAKSKAQHQILLNVCAAECVAFWLSLALSTKRRISATAGKLAVLDSGTALPDLRRRDHQITSVCILFNTAAHVQQQKPPSLTASSSVAEPEEHRWCARVKLPVVSVKRGS
ncbi:uncharacterized protein RHO25_007932 [Cercospora beticola]|uniref:Uncharacterized protein n=1 Tax=Cercospora beticola TaxID=122368 RepID=A0ABZ0NUV6_CERBT|nr:hypothetical protein RHO25_007932 [Cercospora beticola]